MTRPIIGHNGKPVFAYRRGPKTRKPNQHVEADLQVSIKRYLDFALPEEVECTASLTGVNLSKRAAELAHARGVRRGWPDYQFCINRRMFFIELKKPLTAKPRDPSRIGTLDDPGLSVEQRRVLSRLHPDAWAICRSIEQVADALTRWGVQLKARPNGEAWGIR